MSRSHTLAAVHDRISKTEFFSDGWRVEDAGAVPRERRKRPGHSMTGQRRSRPKHGHALAELVAAAHDNLAASRGDYARAPDAHLL